MNLKNKIIEIYNNTSNNSAKWLGIITFCYCLVLIIIFPYGSFYDTTSYFEAWDTIKNGSPDLLRTPIYPIFVGVISEVFGNGILTLYIIKIIQSIVFALSVTFLYKSILILSQRTHITFWVTLAFILFPCTSISCAIVLTESLSISLVSFFIYNLIVILKNKNKVTNYWGLGVSLFLMIFIRPAFIYVFVVLAFCVIYLICKKNFRKSLALMGIIAMISALFLGYCSMINRNYGIFKPSIVSINNNYIMLQENNNYDIDAITNTEIKQMFADNIDYESFRSIPVEYSKAVSQALRSNIIGFLQKCYGRIYRLSGSRFEFLTGPLVSITAPFYPTLNCVWWLVALYSIILVFDFFKFKKIPLLSTTLCLMVIGNIMIVILGAQGEWPRLLLPSIPILAIMSAQLFSFLRININKEYRLS